MRAMQSVHLIAITGAVLILSSGCSVQEEQRRASRPANVLIIGDSISIGYFEPTRKLLEGVANVSHNPGNAAHTAHRLAQLDTWLGDTQWDVIHFNHGLHDMKYVSARGDWVDPGRGVQQIPVEQYAHNLDELVRRLKPTHARLIFATTTPVPEGAVGRVRGDAERYNRAALPIMKKHHVQVNDLYAFALPKLKSIQRPQNVHFTEEGSRVLAEQVAGSIRAALDAQ